MKNILKWASRTIGSLILLAVISNWIFDYGDEIMNIVYIVMFSFIGAIYIIVGFALRRIFLKLFFISCGIYLIIWKFIIQSTILTVIAILCILIPIIIGRFSKQFE